MYQAVLFDLDGTLIDSADDLGAALNFVLAKHYRSTVNSDEYRTQASNGTLALLKLGFGDDWQHLSTATQTELKNEFLTFYANNLWCKSSFYPGVLSLITFLDTHAIPWAIVTNKPQHLTTPLIKQIPQFENCQNIAKSMI